MSGTTNRALRNSWKRIGDFPGVMLAKGRTFERASMWHWRDAQFKEIRNVGSEARNIPEWSDYALFCEKSDLGLRRDALSVLDRFIELLERAPFAERRRFVSWLLTRLDDSDARQQLLPHPLYQRIVLPTLSEWTQTEAGCPEPHVWLGRYEDLKRALELNPHYEVAQQKLIKWILNHVAMATHELPVGYLGDPVQDLAYLAEADALLRESSDSESGSRFSSALGELRTRVETHLKSRAKRIAP
jgi:hypothetical protein